jgi:16S rRNA C967 or C1407 C5-methylase (RsmB/RsmF family)
MLIVLIYEHIIKGEKLKIGGKLSRMVKDNKDALQALLGTEEIEEKTRSLPKYGYLRLNLLQKKEDEGSDSEAEEEVDTIRKTLKAEGYKVKRICQTNII